MKFKFEIIMKDKVIQTYQREVVDKETGEVVSVDTSKIISRKIQDDAFYMVYIDFIAPFFKLKNNAKNILIWMCNHAEFNTGRVSLTTKDRETLADEIGICANTITNNLAALKKAGLIEGEKGVFNINPQVFWKGDLKARRDLLANNEFKIKFSIDGE